MKRLLAVCLLVLVISSCKVLQSDTDSPKLGNTKWILLSIQEKPVKLGENAFLKFDEKENKIAGKAACNSFSGEYSIIKQAIKFESIGATKVYCEGLMDEENLIITALQNTRRYEIKADMLYLYSSDQLLLTYKR